MNNIEILEEFIDDLKPNLLITQAIENIIKENKKLKKQMGKDLDVVYIKGVYDERDKWKSKLKEKIEEIKVKMNNDCIALHGFQREAQIDILQELLKGE